MKKQITFLLAIFISLGITGLAQNHSPYPVKVFEYMPAPGQFINENYPAYESGDTPETMNQKALDLIQTQSGLVSLGAFGGYIVLGFDHPIINSRSDYDFKAYGNADFPNAAEPGIVMVSMDVNKNSLPDDPWYELRGSEYDNCIKNYEITYFRPNPLDGDVSWEDNQGASGIIKRNSYHTQESYYPLWIDNETLTFKGTRFPESALNQNGQWGYVDNVENSGELVNFKIDWAVDENGEYVYLSSIDFIKIYTSVNKDGGALGEISTELRCPGIEDLHPQMTYELTDNTLDPNKSYRILDLSGFLSEQESVWDKTLTYDPALDPEKTGVNEFTFEQGAYVFNYATTWEGFAWEGFTYSNITDRTTAGYDNQFAAITGGGVDGRGSTYAISYYGAYSDINKQYISFTNEKEFQVAGTYVSNSTLTYLSMLNGDGYAKKFGGENGTDPDWFKITFTGEDANGNITGSVDFYLADFRSDNPEDDYIVNEWKWVDLSDLGRVSKIHYTLESSDLGEYGINTPTFFCIDKMAVEAKQNAISENENIIVKIHPNPVDNVLFIEGIEQGGCTIQIYSMTGQLLHSELFTGAPIQTVNWNAGLYLIRIHNGKQSQTVKIIKQ
jgi:hypothetical protein